MWKSCEACGVAATMSQFAKTCVPTTCATPRPSVYVVLNPINEDELAAYSVWQTARYRYTQASLEQVGWDAAGIAQHFAFGHSVRCPTEGKKKIPNAVKKHCAQVTREEIDASRVPVVLVCGTVAWDSLYPELSASDSAVPYKLTRSDGTHYYVVRTSDQSDLIEKPDSNDTDAWLTALRWLSPLAQGYVHDPFRDTDYKIVTTVEEAVAAFDYYAQAPLVAYDIETGNAPYALDMWSKKFKVLCISMSDRAGSATVVPLFHHENPLAKDPRVLAALCRFLRAKNKKIGHNAVSFDDMAFFATLGIWVGTWWDTMLADGILNENRMHHRLKPLTATYVPAMAGYDDELDKAFPPRFTNDARDYELHVPMALLLRYGAADADAAFRLYQRQEELLSAVFSPHWGNMREFFVQFVMRDASAAAMVSANGIVLDSKKRDALLSEIDAQQRKLTAEIHADPCLERFACLKAADFAGEGKWFSDGTHIYAGYPPAAAGLQPVYNFQTGTDIDANARRILTERGLLKKDGKPYVTLVYTKEDVQFRLSAPDDMAYMLQRVFGYVSEQRTATGKMSTDATALEAAAERVPWLKNVLAWKKLEKTAGTYLRPAMCGVYTHTKADGKTERKFGWVREDGYIHPEFLMTGLDHGQTHGTAEKRDGTRTGRKSTRRPNSQNFEKHSKTGKALHNCFVSRYADPRYPFALNEAHAAVLWEAMTQAERAQVNHFIYPGMPGGGAMLQMDYSQLELRILAIVARCSWMIERYRNNADLHLELGMDSFQKSREEVLANGKLLRTAAKRLWFGPVYGQGAPALRAFLVEQDVMSVTYPGQPITLEEVEAALNRLYAKLPEFVEYKQLVHQHIEQHGSIYSIVGRLRRLPHVWSTDRSIVSYAKRQGVNFTIQSPGADCTNDSNVRVNELLLSYAPAFGARRPLVCNNVHDSLWIDTPSEWVPWMYAQSRRIMEDVRLPGLRKDERSVEILVEGEVGPACGNGAEIKGDLAKEWMALAA